jgi:hypothetical protein
VFGFLLPIRFFNERIASFGATVLDRMTSEISRFSAISSLFVHEISKDLSSEENLYYGRTSYCSSLSRFAHPELCWPRMTTSSCWVRPPLVAIR